ncbi:MAG TPA: hypothetical protein VFS30_04850 [Dehalococcoidia bacterium]|nr:hypothetical protein [Dehalococcoidia bacterium]
MSTGSHELTRQSIPGGLAKELQYQIRGLANTDLSEYTYEHSRSQFKNAKTDFSVYDPSGKLILNGRGFGDRDFFWTPTVDARLN